MMETLGQVWPQEQLQYPGYNTEYNTAYCQDFTGYNTDYTEYNIGYNPGHTDLYNTAMYEQPYILPENYYNSLPPSPDYSSGSSLTPSPPPYQTYSNYYDQTPVLPSSTSSTTNTNTNTNNNHLIPSSTALKLPVKVRKVRRSRKIPQIHHCPYDNCSKTYHKASHLKAVWSTLIGRGMSRLIGGILLSPRWFFMA